MCVSRSTASSCCSFLRDEALDFFCSLIFSLFLCLYVVLFDVLSNSCLLGFQVCVRKFSNDSFLCVCAVIMNALFSDEELFLTQNSFSEERVEDNLSIVSILDGLVACDDPVSQNSCNEELKQVVTEKSIKDGLSDPSNYPDVSKED